MVNQISALLLSSRLIATSTWKKFTFIKNLIYN